MGRTNGGKILIRRGAKILLLILAVAGLFACGDKDGENATQHAQLEAKPLFFLNLQEAKNLGNCQAKAASKNCVKAELSFSIQNTEGEALLQQPLNISIKDVRIEESKIQSSKLGDFSIHVEIERSPEELSQIIDLGLKIQTRDFGSQFYLLSLRPSRPENIFESLHPASENNWRPRAVNPLQYSLSLKEQNTKLQKTSSREEQTFNVHLEFQLSTGGPKNLLSLKEFDCRLESGNLKMASDHDFKVKTDSAGIFSIDFEAKVLWRANARILPLKMSLKNSDQLWMQRLLKLDLESHPERPVVEVLDSDVSWSQTNEANISIESPHDLRVTSFQILENPQRRRWVLNARMELGVEVQYDASGILEMSRLSPRGQQWIPLNNVNSRSNLLILDARRQELAFLKENPRLSIRGLQRLNLSTNDEGYFQFSIRYFQPLAQQLSWIPIELGVQLEFPEIQQASLLNLRIQPTTQSLEPWDYRSENEEIQSLIAGNLENIAETIALPSEDEVLKDALNLNPYLEEKNLSETEMAKRARLKTLIDHFKLGVNADEVKELESLVPQLPADFHTSWTEVYKFYLVKSVSRESLELKEPANFSWFDIALEKVVRNLPAKLKFKFSAVGLPCIWLSLHDQNQKKMHYRRCEIKDEGFSAEEIWYLSKEGTSYRREHGANDYLYSTRVFPKN